MALVEAYAKTQGLWHDPDRQPVFSTQIELDLSTIEPSLAGPTRPHDRLALGDAKRVQRAALSRLVLGRSRGPDARPVLNRGRRQLAAGGLDEASAESFPASDPPAASGPTAHIEDPVRTRPEDSGTLNLRPHRGHADWWHHLRGRSQPRGDRRHHQLHQHVEPRRHDRRRTAGQEGGGTRPHRETMGEDVTGPRVTGGDGLLHALRAAALPGGPGVQPGGIRLHHLHRQLRSHRSGPLGPRRRTSLWCRCSRATGTSRDASIPTSA